MEQPAPSRDAVQKVQNRVVLANYPTMMSENYLGEVYVLGGSQGIFALQW
jgi:hypothetical protein